MKLRSGTKLKEYKPSLFINYFNKHTDKINIINILKDKEQYKKNHKYFFYIGRRLLNKYNCNHYKLTLNNSTECAAWCNYTNEEISVSIYYLASNIATYNDIYETILHEIAHALTPNTKKHHSKEWKECYLKLGGNGKTGCDVFMDEYTSRYIIKCEKGCKHFRQKLHNASSSCRVHKTPYQIIKNY